MRRSLVFVLCLAAAVPAAAQTAQPATTTDTSVGGMFVELWHDLPRLVLPSNLIILGAGGTIALAVEGSDDQLSERFANSQELAKWVRGGSGYGDGWVQITGAVGTYVAGHITGNAKVLTVGSDLVQAQILNTVLTEIVKATVPRTRPDGGHNSFPSGHTSSTFANAAVLARHFGWRVGIPAYGLASWVATARVQERHHFVSDVVFGAALGTVSGRTVTVGKGAGKLQVAPSLVPGGAAIFLTRTR